MRNPLQPDLKLLPGAFGSFPSLLFGMSADALWGDELCPHRMGMGVPGPTQAWVFSLSNGFWKACPGTPRSEQADVPPAAGSVLEQLLRLQLLPQPGSVLLWTPLLCHCSSLEAPAWGSAAHPAGL